MNESNERRIMNRFHLLTPQRRAGLAVAAASAMFVGAVAVTIARAADTATPKKKLTGAELYAINCNRCHNERYPTERPKGEWKTIMTHMRVRANLPAAQAKEILKYLQENAGSNP
jgi:mono/diheme cytochrome c family protein